MAFALLVAADVAGDKQNFEISFSGQPSMAEVENGIVGTYQTAFPGHPFNIGRMQFYDEVLGKWADLVSSAQLRDFMQIYAFNRGVVEVQKPIPPPRKVAGSVAGGPAYRSGVGSAPPSLPSAVSAGGVAAAAGGIAGGPPPTLSDSATHEEKVRAVFDELDVNNNRTLEPEEFRRGFRAHSFDFPAAVVADLFSRADANQDGVLSPPEFQRFAELYPTLLDSLYFRIRDYWEDFRQKQSIDQAHEALEANKETERLAHLAHVDAQQATTTQERKLAAAEQAVGEASEGEARAHAKLLEIQRELEAFLRERAQKAREVELARERERQRVASHGDAQRETDGAEQALAWQEAEQAKMQDRERHAHNAAAEAQREMERARRLEQEASAELEAAREREHQANGALAEEKRQTELAVERLKQCELELQQKTAYERELQQAVHEALAELEAEKGSRDHDEGLLAGAREQERLAHLAHLDAQRAIEEQEKKMLAIEAERQAAVQRRRQVEDQERPLLEQEVRLREQRESLEEKESKLRKEATAFHNMRGVPRGVR